MRTVFVAIFFIYFLFYFIFLSLSPYLNHLSLIYAYPLYEPLQTCSDQAFTGSHWTWKVASEFLLSTKSGEWVSWFAFYSSWKLNVTGLLRAELFENYWTITSLRLKFAGWLFNFVTLRWEVFQLTLLLHHLPHLPAIGSYTKCLWSKV